MTAAVGRRTRPPLWRDVRVLRVAFQVAVVAAVVALIVFLYDNATTRQAAQGIDRDFSYLGQPAGVRIAYSDFSPGESVGAALRVGVKNTALVALVGVVLALVLGTVIGIARLSTNWLVRKAAAIYVETLRNIPPLLVIIFVNAAIVLNALPRIQDSVDLGGLLILNNRELAIVSLAAGSGAGAYVGILGAGLVGAVVLGAWLTRRSAATGAPHHRILWGTGVLVAAAVAGYVALGGPVTLSRASVVNRNIDGGVAMSTGYAALLVGLVIYTASHIAEIVRGSIQAVHRGQSEAADSLGLSSFQRLRFIVLPQAFRIAIPPTINQFLNLTKNTSLGIAVAFSEITLITRQVIGNGNPAVQSVLILMAVYLCFSIPISVLTNLVNRRLQLVER